MEVSSNEWPIKREKNMPTYANLQDFMADLEKNGELVRIKVSVDPVLEITEIADRVMKTDCPQGLAGVPWHDPANGRWGGKALLFENVKGSTVPVLINAYGSYHRMYRALGVKNFGEMAERVAKLIKPEIPTSFLDKLKKGLEVARIASFPPKIVSRGICQEVVHTGEQVDVTKLPLLHCWPLDGQAGMEGKPADAAGGTGRYVTMGGIFTRHPLTGDRNVGMYRVQLYGPKLMAMHWHLHHDGAGHYRAWKEHRPREKMPIAVVIGGESVLPFAATCPLPSDVSELLFAGMLNDGAIELVECVSQKDLHVPANAEIVIEGYIDPSAPKIWEGPFGDHTGYYSSADQYPAMHVTAVTHRRSPIWLATIVGKPPMEDYFLGKATERIFLPLLKILVPDIVDYDLPMFGAFHNCVFVKIRKVYPYQARRVMHAIWGAGQMAFTKMIMVVDEHVNVHDVNEVLFYLGANFDPSRDIELVRGPVDILDHASVAYGAGGKIGFDGTRKLPGERPPGEVRHWPMELEMPTEIKDLVNKRWKEYGIESLSD